MTKEIFKTVAAGILAGIVLFMIPFLLIKVIVFFLLIKAIFRLLGGRRRWHGMHPAFAHKYQNMSEADRKAFMEKYGKGCCNWHSTCEPSDTDKKQNV